MRAVRADSFRGFLRTATGGFTPYNWELQVAIVGLPDVLPVPTGLGKTEVALAWAWRLLIDKQSEPLHVVVCLPMRGLVTQTMQRLKTYFDVLKVAKSLVVRSPSYVLILLDRFPRMLGRAAREDTSPRESPHGV